MTLLSRFLVALYVSAGSVSAAEHVGLVRSNELPIPGTSVIATQGETKLVTSTDQTGRYRFAQMQPGVWTLEVSMFGFESVTREIEVTDVASLTEWELTLAAREQQAAPGDGEQLSRAERRERFQRLLVNETQQNSIMNALAAMPDPTISMAAEQDANESFLVTGSLSRGLQAPGGNDPFNMRGLGFGGPSQQGNPFANRSGNDTGGGPGLGRGGRGSGGRGFGGARGGRRRARRPTGGRPRTGWTQRPRTRWSWRAGQR